MQECQNSIVSDRTLLDIPHEESLMLKTKFTYLKGFDITWDFDLAVQQCTEIAVQTQYSHCNTQLDCSTDLIPITGLHMLTITMLGIPRCWEGICEVSPLLCLKFILSVFSFYTLLG